MPDTVFPEAYLDYLLARAAALATARFHGQIRRHGVSATTWRILGAVIDAERTVSDVAALVLMKQPTLSKALDRLERDDLVVRRRSLEERRLVFIGLTAKGRKLAETLRQAAERHEAEMARHLPLAQIDAMKATLRQLINQLDRPVSAPPSVIPAVAKRRAEAQEHPAHRSRRQTLNDRGPGSRARAARAPG